MKTIRFERVSEAYGIDPSTSSCYHTDTIGAPSGTYVLATEANERIAYLEKAYKELHRDTTAMMGEDKERIQVLEDALRPMLEVCKDPKSYDLVRVSEIISKALEVK